MVLLTTTLAVMSPHAMFQSVKSTQHIQNYAADQMEFYWSSDEVGYIRPGFHINVESVAVNADSKVEAVLSFTDDFNQPLDRAGQVTPGPLSISFIVAWYDGDARQNTDYSTRNETDPDTGITEIQATTDSHGVLTDLSLGRAHWTSSVVIPSDKVGRTHTLAIYATRSLTDIIGKDYYANVETDFRPDGGVVTEQWAAFTNATCNNCHHTLGAHGGSRQDVKLCVTCHSPQTTDAETGNTVNFKVMIHKIHDGANLPSVLAGTPYEIIGYQNSVNDFSTVVFPQDIRNCSTCHQASAPEGYIWMTRPNRAACGSCHDDVNFATGENHDGGPQADDSACASCHAPQGEQEFDASITGAHTVEYKSKQLHGLVMQILSVAQAVAGQAPIVTFQVKDRNGFSMDPRPFDTLRFTMGGPTTDYASLPISENAQSGTTFDGTNAVYAFQTPIPANATETWAMTADVELTVILHRGDGQPDITDFTESPLNPVFYMPITDPQPVPRREVVALDNCNVCHDRIALHGGQRLNTQGCVICHNANVDDSSQRPADQLPPESIHFKRMIHRLHTGENLEQDFTIYGYGGRPHNYNGLRFPGDLRKCDACHVAGTYTVPLPDGVLPTPTPRDWYPLMQPTAAACLACHSAQDAAAHAYTMTAPFGEACEVCHGNDADFSVDKVHAR